MEAILWFAVFVGGLVLRAALAVAVVALVAIPIVLVIFAVRGGYRLYLRMQGAPAFHGAHWDSRAYYTPGHTWLRRAGRDFCVGFDDLAQRLLMGNGALDLPTPGRVVRAGDVVGAVRAGDKETALVAPIAGTITGINADVARDPSLIHRDPYGRGWLYRLTPADGGLERLRRGPSARAWLEDEHGRLGRFLETELGVAAADGGEIVAPAPSLLTAEQWGRLAQAFLR